MPDDGKILPGNWNFAFLVGRLWLPPLIPAKQVQFLTSASDRTCRAWCSGQSEPPSWVLVAVLASDDGERALAILMGEFGPAWFRGVLRAKRIAEAVDREI